MIKLKIRMNSVNRLMKLFVLSIIFFIFLLIVWILLSPVIFDNHEVSITKQVYFVSNNGDDLNNGTSPNSPWKTIKKLNYELNWGVIKKGDDIYFKRGDTFDQKTTIYLRGKGGKRNDSMVFGAYGSGSDPIITSSSADPLIYFLNDETGYWTFENLYFRAPNNCGSFNLISGNTGDKYNLTIRNCTFDGNNYGSNGHKGNILLYNVHDYLIRDCTFIDASHYFYGKGVGDKPNSNTRMINCTFDGKGGSQDNIQIHCEYDDPTGNAENHLILNVTSTNCTANAFDIVGGWYRQYKCENVYIKNCIGDVVGSNAPIVIGHGVSNVTVENCFFQGPLYLTRSNNTIVRNCVFKDSISGYIISQDDPQWDFGWGTQNCTLYNNDFIVSGGTRFIHTDVGATGPDNLSGFFIKNNIFYSTVYSSPSLFVYYDEEGPGVNNLENTDSYFSHNLWWRGDGNFNNRWVLDGGTYNLVGWNALNRVDSEIGKNPNLSNPTGNNFPSDFQLTSGSSCIDAGEWLTHTNGAGSGTTITVDEANYFFPGMSVFGIDGDTIFVGNDKDLKITAVDYTAETITVDRTITWSDGEIVSLSAYNGSAPDIGAFEYPSIGQHINTPDISNIVLTESDPLDTDISYGWINITATVTSDSGVDKVMLNIFCPNGSSFNVSMNEIGSNNYYYYTNTIFSNHGDHNYYIWANDTYGNASTSFTYDFAMPPNWDVDMNRKCNVFDFILVSNHYNETGSNGWIREDIDNNGVVNLVDFVIVSQNYGKTW